MFRRLFGRGTPPQPETSAWWREANALALTPDADHLASLRTSVADAAAAPDEAESQEEMLDGLDRVLVLATAPALPVVDTQHRVIGQAMCHFLAPASLIGQVDAAGKLFATADKLVFAAGSVQQWPWHSVAAMTRVDRDVIIDLRGNPGAARLRLNTYGDATVVVAIAARLRAREP